MSGRWNIPVARRRLSIFALVVALCAGTVVPAMAQRSGNVGGKVVDEEGGEEAVREKINALAHVAFEEKDYSTFNFLQWYVAEQHEEEKLFNTILDKMRIIGTEGRGLYHFDQEITKMIDGGGSINTQP